MASIKDFLQKKLEKQVSQRYVESFLREINSLDDWDYVIEKTKIMSKGYIWREFRSHLRINAVACVRAVMLQNFGQPLTAKEIAEIAQKKFGNRKVSTATVYNEYNCNPDNYDDEGYYPTAYSLNLDSFREVWEKVFVEEEELLIDA